MNRAGSPDASKLRKLSRALGTSSRVAWWLGMLVGVPGLLMRDSVLVCAAAVLLPLGFVLHDAARARRGGITAMTAYSAAAVATSFANTVAVLAADTPERGRYYLYVSEPHVHLAMCLGLAAAVIPPAAFWLVNESKLVGLLHGVLPSVRGEIPDRQLVVGATLIGLLAALLHIRFSFSAFGALSSVLFLAPTFVVFVLARAAAERGVPHAYGCALIVACAEAVRALLFGYLRGDVAAPFVSFVLGALIGARSLRPLRSRIFIPLYGALIVFIAYFAAFGAVRGHSEGGLQRLKAMQAFDVQNQDATNRQDQTVLSRLTTINQLSQIGRLVDEGGYLHGQTLEYLSYAFIPRFIWPNKPAISMGAWFALQIGQAYVKPNGSVTNAINMTIPGEFYLNYGWKGVLVGLSALGVIIAAFWQTTAFWQNPRNVLGTAFAFYLMWPWIGFSLGADLEILVTIVAVYLVLLAVGFALPRPRSRTPALDRATISIKPA